MDILRSIFDYAGNGVKGFWPYLMQMPISLATALGFTAVVLLAATLVLAKFVRRAHVPGSVYGLVAAAILVTWLFSWFSSLRWGAASDFCAGVSRVASLVSVFWIAFVFVQTLLYPQHKKP